MLLALSAQAVTASPTPEPRAEALPIAATIEQDAKITAYNDLLKFGEEADCAHSPRYAQIADIDHNIVKALSGESASLPCIEGISEKVTDWYVGAHALLQRANLATALSRTTHSVLLVSEAESQIRGGGIEAIYRPFEISEARAFRLISIYDLCGASKIMEQCAHGDHQGSLRLIRSHLKSIATADAQMFDAGRRKITDEDTRNLGLRAQLLKSQRAIIGLALAVLAGGAVMLALQIRLAIRYRIQRQKAEAATEAKGEFLSNMSHEIRTPLTAIIGFAELLGDRHDLPEDALSQVRKIVDGGNALLLIVNDILDFSRIESGQLELETTPFNPGDVVSRAVGLVEGMAQAKGLALHFEPSSDLPEFVMGDPGRLRQAILNLLNNAVKFTASGSVRVSLSYDPAAARLACSVVDTGPGIPAERQNLLFKRFSQIDSSVSRLYGGSGLGLAITRSLVELMGGEITVDSKEGEGSTFSFYVKAPAAAGRITEGAGSIPIADFEGRQGQVVLIVDDREENRDILSQMIASVGLCPAVAESGEEALSLALQTRYDLILMDVRMPGLSGLDAARILRETCDLNKRTPILAITANVSAEEIEECRQAGMQDHIGKPIRAAELVAKLSVWVGAEI